MGLESVPTGQLIFHTFDTIRRAVIQAAGVEQHRVCQFDAELFRVLQAVASNELTMFPGLADVKVAIDGELELTPAETTEIGDKLHIGMQLDREIAQRLLTFLRLSNISAF